MLGSATACPTRQHAAWFEIESQDLDVQKGAVKLSISEYNEPWDGKTQTPKAYSGGAYVTPIPFPKHFCACEQRTTFRFGPLNYT